MSQSTDTQSPQALGPGVGPAAALLAACLHSNSRLTGLALGALLAFIPCLWHRTVAHHTDGVPALQLSAACHAADTRGLSAPRKQLTACAGQQQASGGAAGGESSPRQSAYVPACRWPWPCTAWTASSCSGCALLSQSHQQSMPAAAVADVATLCALHGANIRYSSRDDQRSQAIYMSSACCSLMSAAGPCAGYQGAAGLELAHGGAQLQGDRQHAQCPD